MTQGEANKKMVSLFETMVGNAEQATDAKELFDYTDAAHKLYITLSSAGAFDSSVMSDGGFKN